MAALEVLALVENSPAAGEGRIRAPATGDTYAMPRSLAITPEANKSGLSISGYSLNGANAQSAVDIAGTWNTSGTPTALKINITDMASNAASLLMDLQVGGVSYFSIRKNGFLSVAGSIQTPAGGGGGLNLANDTGTLTIGASYDTKLTRDAAGVFAQRNGVNAQAFRIYNTYTNASNYERLSLGWSGNRFTMDTGEAGTGAARGITIGGADLILANLPTADPAVAGQLWNNLGILTVSAG